MSKPLLCLASLALPLLLLNGCASLSEGQCVKGNWNKIGEKDALGGYPSTRLADHYDACAKYNIKPDVQAYQAGYNQGLLGYCIPVMGFSEGRNGSTYYHQCPPQMEGPFLAAWDRGVDVGAVESDISSLDSNISALEDKIKDKDTSDSKRDKARRELEDARRDRRQRQYDLDALLSKARARGLVD